MAVPLTDHRLTSDVVSGGAVHPAVPLPSESKMAAMSSDGGWPPSKSRTCRTSVDNSSRSPGSALRRTIGRWDRRLRLAPLVGDAERGDRFLSNRVVGVCLGYGDCLGRGAAGRTTSTPNNQYHGSAKPFFSLTVWGQKNDVKCAMLNDKLIIH